MLHRGFEQSIHVTKLMREAAGIVKRQSRFLRLFTTPARPKHTTNLEKTPICIFCERPDHMHRATWPES